MTPEIGHFALILAFMLALIQGPALFMGARGQDARFAVFGQRASILIFCLVGLSFFSLMHAYAVSDFSVVNVFENSHSAKPFIYKLTGTWGNHEGSMLLWALILTLFSAVLALQGRAAPRDLLLLTLGVQALIIAAFLAFILFTSNPFERLIPAPADGTGLNPLLQDPGLAIHPPFLYLGYVGFSIPFSFAVAALIRGRADSVWARLVRPWALIAWVFLTIGIMLGSWWAYYELGWGGWWAWDPVENASFMPWLAGTALIHSIRVVERRDAMKGWALLLAITTFSLSLVGTFLVRSGVITSVHAFAVDPARGVFILAILFAAIGGSLSVFAFRANSLSATGAFAPVSREGALVVNNVLLLVACAVVFVGTFYPLFIDVLSGEKISVGAPYYNLIFAPLASLTLILAAVGTLLAWKKGDLGASLRKLWPASAAALAVAIIAAVVADRARISGAFAMGLVVWLAGGAFLDIAERIKLFRAPLAQSLSRAKGLPGAAWGASIAHGGLALFALGAASMSLWKTEVVQLMAEGDSAAIAGYEVTLQSVERLRGPNYEAERATFVATKNNESVTLAGERRFYPVRGMETSEAAIRARGPNDLYISFGANTSGNGWPVRLFFNPLVGFLWIGAGVTAFGGLIAFGDRGRKPAKLRKEKPAPAGAETAPA
ncbi:heme lyase CcmF/NrfE family subunit [Hyphococcus sp.]|jgi:cytochrome c-type biogenesis protein CcmF|uniref:heme lyase CcmF/NrfE family subunit n=1 Tax=Hyphococcus sp. TaxID=2038636 RepID=UPI003D12BFD5